MIAEHMVASLLAETNEMHARWMAQFFSERRGNSYQVLVRLCLDCNIPTVHIMGFIDFDILMIVGLASLG